MEIYDLAIIGGGPAGYNAAERAAQAGLNVIIFETNRMGGVCLNEGCIPTKTLLHTSKMLSYIRDIHKYGIQTSDPTYDYSVIYNRKNKVIDMLVSGVENRLKKHKVKVVQGHAQMEPKNNDQFVIKVAGDSFHSKNIMIATGASPIIPSIPGLAQAPMLTSKELLDLQHVPSSLVVIGGGYIGLEFAGFYAALGTQVTVVEMQDEVSPGMDREVSKWLRQALVKQGIKFQLKSKVTRVEGNQVMIETEKGEQVLKGEKILVSVGRKPNLEGYGLENLGVELEKGGIKVDVQGRTNIPGVFAAGDVNGKSLLAHTAYREGEVVVNTITGKNDQVRYHTIPGVIYTNPEVASVGYSEEMAVEKGVEYVVKKLPMSYSGRFLAENEGKQGYCKILAGKKYGEILGVHLLGGVCSEMIYGAALMMENEFRISDAQELVFPHPTVSEVIRETLFAFED